MRDSGRPNERYLDGPVDQGSCLLARANTAANGTPTNTIDNLFLGNGLQKQPASGPGCTRTKVRETYRGFGCYTA